MASGTVLNRLKSEFNSSGMLRQLIIINSIVFVAVILLRVSANLFQIEPVFVGVMNALAMPGEFSGLLYQPWSLVTNLFTHEAFSHFIWNMVGLYFVGRLFLSFFEGNRLLMTYLLGGMFGALLHVLSYNLPLFDDITPKGVIGASASIYAVMGAILYYRPKTTINLPFNIAVPFWLIAVLFLIGDISNLDQLNGVSNFAHIGGAIFGAVSMVNIDRPNQFMNRLTRYWTNINWRNPFKRQPRFKVYKSDEVRQMTDDQYRSHKKNNQDKVNAILDKINKGGYDSLSKAEKEFLFKYGNDL